MLTSPASLAVCAAADGVTVVPLPAGTAIEVVLTTATGEQVRESRSRRAIKFMLSLSTPVPAAPLLPRCFRAPGSIALCRRSYSESPH